MAVSAVLAVHIAAGAVGLVSGAAALSVRKGERLHRIAGTVFFLSMLAMAGLGTLIAAEAREPLAFIPGLVTFYLVATAWAAVRRGEGRIGRFERVACAAGLGIAAVGVVLGLVAGGAATTPMLLIFSALVAFAALQDRKVIRSGGVSGADRIARHLWRMCAALTIAAFSFFLGQQDEFPLALQGPQNAIPPLAVLATMVFWLVRLRRPRKAAAVTV